MTCQFRNKKRPTVIVKKVMVGGTDSFAFTGTPSGTISENGGTIVQQLPDGGTFTSTEAPKAGWTLTSIACDDSNSTGSVETRTATFVATAGEVVTCTFTNTRMSQVIVKKIMNGGEDSFSYSGTPAGIISENEGTISAFVAPVSTRRPRPSKEGWDLHSIACDDANSGGSVADRARRRSTSSRARS